MFNDIHSISIMLLGNLPISEQILYFISDFFLLAIMFIVLIYIILLPIKLISGR